MNLRAALACLALMTAPAAQAAGSFSAQVVVVVDGDTVVVRSDRGRRYEVRIAGIDAPEISQPYGVRSRSHLAEIAYGKAVTVHWYKRDRYRRVLGRVMVGAGGSCAPSACGAGTDAGYAQVADGYAWHDREHLDEQALDDRVRYGRAEQEARSRRAGLWAESSPTPPWRYRHLHPRRIDERRRDR